MGGHFASLQPTGRGPFGPPVAGDERWGRVLWRESDGVDQVKCGYGVRVDGIGVRWVGA